MAVVVPYDELTSLLRRCTPRVLVPLRFTAPLTVATVEAEALFGVGISGSGAVAETVL